MWSADQIHFKWQRSACVPPLWAWGRSSPHIPPRHSSWKPVGPPPPREQEVDTEHSVLPHCVPSSKEPSPHTGSRDFHQQKLRPERGKGEGCFMGNNADREAKANQTPSELNWPCPAAVWQWSALSHWTQWRAQDQELRTPSPCAAGMHASPQSWTADRESNVIITVRFGEVTRSSFSLV